MAIKLFNRKQNTYTKLDALMMKMASTETYLEYVQLRERV
jgi:hypothetical protein